MEGSTDRCRVCLRERVLVSLSSFAELTRVLEELIGQPLDDVASDVRLDLCLDCKEKLIEFGRFKKRAAESQARFLSASDVLIKSEPSNDPETSDTSDSNNGGSKVNGNHIGLLPQKVKSTSDQK